MRVWMTGVAALVVATAGCGGRPLQQVDGSPAVVIPGGGDAAAAFDGLRDVPVRPDGVGFDGSVIEGMQCHLLPNSAPYIVAETRPAGMAPPELPGGTISDGRYELIAAAHYPGDAAVPPGLMHRTVQFELGATRWLLTEFVPAPGGDAGSNLRASAALTPAPDGRLTATFESCYPASANEYRFEATPDTVTMWHERTRMLLHYLRVSG